MKNNKYKFSIINVITPFVYLILLGYTAVWIGTYLGIYTGQFVCNYIIPNNSICLVENPDDGYYIILRFCCFILPYWIIIAIFWFFIVKYFNKKLKQKN